VLATPRYIKESERHPGHFDLLGALTSTLGMVLLVYGFIRASEEGWSDPLTLGAFGAALVFLIAFIAVERRSRQPITPLWMFRDRNRSGVYAMMLSLSAAIFGMFFFLTLFVQNILGFSPLKAGFAFLPVSVIIAIGAGVASNFLPRWGPKPFMVVGAILAALGLGWLTLTDIDSTYLGSILGPTLVFGFGMGLQFVSLTLMAVSGVQPRDTGAASGILNATQQVGGSLGLSVLVTVFGTASRNEATDQVKNFLSTATPAQQLQFRRTGQLPAPWSNEVLTSGITGAFVAAAAFAVVAALVALIVIQVRPSDLERLQGGAAAMTPVDGAGDEAGASAGAAPRGEPDGRDGPSAPG